MDQTPMLNKVSKIFFTIFFAAIVASIALTYYTIEVRHHFHAFTVDETIPDPVEEYQVFFGYLLRTVHLAP